MHWLVFEEDGLPDGTEVAYYSHGKVMEINITSANIWNICIQCLFIIVFIVQEFLIAETA